MSYKNDKNSTEESVIKYLKNNKNFFVKNFNLIKELNFPIKDESTEKIVDLEAYRYKKVSREKSIFVKNVQNSFFHFS